MTLYPILAVLLSYIAGSIPAAYLAGKARGVDLRQHGSGNLGATNVFRVLGAKIGVLVFLVDVAKGALPVIFFAPWTGGRIPELLLQVACGVAAILGHVRPLFLGFRRGGKGVATAAGVFVGLAPVPALAAFTTFVIVLLATGYVSLGSLTAAAVLPVAILVAHGAKPLFYLAVVVALFVFWTHRANIGRLRRGEEHRFGRRRMAG